MRTIVVSGDYAMVRFILELVNHPETGLFGHLAPEGEPPIEFSGWLSLIRHLEDLTPGRYAMLCFVPTADGTPHAFEGMAVEFTVE